VARVTVEDCMKKVPNRFELVILGAKRARQLINGEAPLIKSDNRDWALREIAAGRVRRAGKELKRGT